MYYTLIIHNNVCLIMTFQSECIILRERKLNIAPAIKKQPFNRSFDGGTGSPTTVPANTYYYSNGRVKIDILQLYTLYTLNE